MFNTFGTIEGYCTDNPKTRKFKTGKDVAEFMVACNHYSATSDDPKVSYIDVVCYEKMAEAVQDVKKGTRLMVIGDLRQDRWTDDNNKVCQRIKLVAKDIRR